MTAAPPRHSIKISTAHRLWPPLDGRPLLLRHRRRCRRSPRGSTSFFRRHSVAKVPRHGRSVAPTPLPRNGGGKKLVEPRGDGLHLRRCRGDCHLRSEAAKDGEPSIISCCGGRRRRPGGLLQPVTRPRVESRTAWPPAIREYRSTRPAPRRQSRTVLRRLPPWRRRSADSDANRRRHSVSLSITTRPPPASSLG